jgi:hypothetical protein
MKEVNGNMGTRTETTDLDHTILQIGEVVLSPVQYTIQDRLKTINTNLGSIGTNNFTITNSTNTDLSKADLDTIVTNTGTIHSNLTTTNSTNIDLSKADLDSVLVAENLRNSPFFEFITSTIRPVNTTAYTVNQAYSTAVAGCSTITTARANSMIQIDEICIVDNNTNAPITPTIYFSETPTGVTWADQTVPNTFTQTNVPYMEIVVSSVLVKIPGNASNVNILKSAITNLNIKLKTDASGNVYYGVVTSTVFTPISNEYFTVSVKGRYL